MTLNLRSVMPIGYQASGVNTLLKGIIFAAILVSESVIARALSLVPYDSPPELEGGRGYVLVKLDVGGTAPSIEFAKMYANGNKYLLSGQKYKLRKKGRYKVSLKDKSEGFYLMTVPAGLYQITQINAPYFNLPYKLDTAKQRTWRFHVEAKKTNYIGSLFIGKQRKSDTVEVYFKNRIATDLDGIQEAINSLTELYPLVSGAGVQDEFLQSWLSPLEINQ
ncbi:hypothetical protein ACJJIQ_06080 [Microbulbifer sp. ANSA003]|uniref:hypothetical protein n=1 Tax=Microbulbifer sp. ANSA003 TaxID=3243360 RepID=UPI0040412E10